MSSREENKMPNWDQLIEKGATGSSLPQIIHRPSDSTGLGATGSTLPNISVTPPIVTNERSQD